MIATTIYLYKVYNTRTEKYLNFKTGKFCQNGFKMDFYTQHKPIARIMRGDNCLIVRCRMDISVTDRGPEYKIMEGDNA